MPKSYTVDDDNNDSRLDKWFKNEIINLPHSLLEKILRQNKIKVNKKKNKIILQTSNW
jgi:23S rRNA-/tRNA-specific pseudouridylate synthase